MPSFDRADLLARVMGDEELAREVVGTFLVDFPTQRERLEAALGEGVGGGFERMAHTMKGAAATVGAVALSGVAGELERLGRAGARVEAVRLLSRLNEEFDRYAGAVREEGWEAVGVAGRLQ